jgi:hypothetical protein
MKNDSDDHPEGQTRPHNAKNHFAFIPFEVNKFLFLNFKPAYCAATTIATHGALLF